MVTVEAPPDAAPSAPPEAPPSVPPLASAVAVPSSDDDAFRVSLANAARDIRAVLARGLASRKDAPTKENDAPRSGAPLLAKFRAAQMDLAEQDKVISALRAMLRGGGAPDDAIDRWIDRHLFPGVDTSEGHEGVIAPGASRELLAREIRHLKVCSRPRADPRAPERIRAHSARPARAPATTRSRPFFPRTFRSSSTQARINRSSISSLTDGPRALGGGGNFAARHELHRIAAVLEDLSRGIAKPALSEPVAARARRDVEPHGEDAEGVDARTVETIVSRQMQTQARMIEAWQRDESRRLRAELAEKTREAKEAREAKRAAESRGDDGVAGLTRDTSTGQTSRPPPTPVSTKTVETQTVETSDETQTDAPPSSPPPPPPPPPPPAPPASDSDAILGLLDLATEEWSRRTRIDTAELIDAASAKTETFTSTLREAIVAAIREASDATKASTEATVATVIDAVDAAAAKSDADAEQHASALSSATTTLADALEATASRLDASIAALDASVAAARAEHSERSNALSESDAEERRAARAAAADAAASLVEVRRVQRLLHAAQVDARASWRVTFDAHVRELSDVVASLREKQAEDANLAARLRDAEANAEAERRDRRRATAALRAAKEAAEEAREAKCAAELDAARSADAAEAARERAAEEIARARDVALRQLREGADEEKEGADEEKEGADEEKEGADVRTPSRGTVETAPRAHLAELAECRRQRDVAEADVREATRRLRANAEELFDARREIARLRATLRRRERAAEAENDAVGDAVPVASPEVDALLRDALDARETLGAMSRLIDEEDA